MSTSATSSVSLSANLAEMVLKAPVSSLLSLEEPVFSTDSPFFEQRSVAGPPNPWKYLHVAYTAVLCASARRLGHFGHRTSDFPSFPNFLSRVILH